jgi:hypothetical protein
MAQKVAFPCGNAIICAFSRWKKPEHLPRKARDKHNKGKLTLTKISKTAFSAGPFLEGSLGMHNISFVDNTFVSVSGCGAGRQVRKRAFCAIDV